MAVVEEQRTYLKDGDEYKESLRDGREVYYRGERIDDVTTHPATAGGIDIIAGLYDDQFEGEGRDVLTYERDDGARVTASMLLPRTKEDLAFRREGIEYIARKTFGVIGRGIDMISTLPLGMVAELKEFERYCPEYADNIVQYVNWAQENNIHMAEVIVDPQGFRSRPNGTSEDMVPPERATARIVKESDEGIWVSGVKGVGTATPQANEIILGSFHVPLAEEAFWVVLPVGTEGLRYYCRELVHSPGASADDHPIDSRGEEIEAIVCFDEVFVPRERIFAMKAVELHGANFYNYWARIEHWYTFIRMVAKAELFAGLAQLVVDTLELGQIPVVRQRVADVIEYAQICRGMAMAAEEAAFLSENDVMTPNHNVVTAGRSYALTHYPKIMHILRDICGQGLIFRFSDDDLASPAAYGKDLGWFLDTKKMSSKEKNLVMNLVWDVTSSAHASRVDIFEQSNALNVPFLKERLYGDYERDEFVNICRRWIGLPDGEPGSYAPKIETRWSEKESRKIS
jgi:4-hydroxyphenylacetate 3-monooxygenase